MTEVGKQVEKETYTTFFNEGKNAAKQSQWVEIIGCES